MVYQQITELKEFLDVKVEQYNRPDFIENDPICIPHLFTKKQDIEIMAFWASILAWGQRTTIINKSKELINLMDGSPHDFICNHQDIDLKRFESFKHRTFNATDTLYFIAFFKDWYSKYDSLEDAFSSDRHCEDDEGGRSNLLIKTTITEPIETALNRFREVFFSLPYVSQRTKKHVSHPDSGSTCKRLNMFLRWMVRDDNKGVDFGIWKKIQPADLICPLDLHVERVARKLNFIDRKQVDWKAAIELTTHLRKLDPTDPVKYDFALFSLSIEEKFR